MDVKPSSDGALGQPTRARLFALLGDLKRKAGTEELAGHLGLHPNGIRNHLEHMLRAGLVVRERERRGRGRPRDLWAIDPAAAPHGGSPTAYAELSGWLVQAVECGAAEPAEIERVGRGIGSRLTDGGGSSDAPEARFFDALAAMGFQPSRTGEGAGRITYCLNNCPYRDTARSTQPLICGLHRGITRGLLESLEPGSELSSFVIRDPDSAGCTIGVDWPTAAGS